DERGRHVASEQVSQEELALAVANLSMQRLAEREFHYAMIEQRSPRLEREGHGRSVHLYEDGGGQVVLHGERQARFDVGPGVRPARALVRPGPSPLDGGEDLRWLDPGGEEILVRPGPGRIPELAHESRPRIRSPRAATREQGRNERGRRGPEHRCEGPAERGPNALA